MNAREATPKPGSEPPDWLQGEAAEEWRRLAPVLYRLGLLTEIDGAALATYCATYARWRDAERHLAADGMVITGKGGYLCQSPYIPIANRCIAQMRSFLIEFGMTPSARSKVQTSADRDSPGDPFSEFDAREPWRR